MKIELHNGDCLDIVPSLSPETVDLTYLDPPFFTQRKHVLSSRDRKRKFSFDDTWKSVSEYASFLAERLTEIRRLLKPTGSLFFHCDKTASHVARLILDDVFGTDSFQSEIIWCYRRWSNSARRLLPAHQVLLFYAKTGQYKFNTIMTEYSPTTNIDQILQRRSRDKSNKSTYARDENGDVVFGGSKKGVPLSDVWEIPFLNPKAKERTGYPTQKPLLLLERILELVTEPGDLVLDPFCGSGTTLVAAKLLGRRGIGIDVSEDAVALCRARLENPVRTESAVVRKGADAYRNADKEALSYLRGVDHTPVHRNSGIDAFLGATYAGLALPVRVQRPGEPLSKAAASLYRAARTKGIRKMILVAIEDVPELLASSVPDEVVVVPSAPLGIQRLIGSWDDQEAK